MLKPEPKAHGGKALALRLHAADRGERGVGAQAVASVSAA
jgi:hypothetical protein